MDITVHEVLRDKDSGGVQLKELDKVNGGDWGGLKVDEEFIKFLRETIGPDVMEVVENRYREDYITILNEFEIKKRGISPNLDANIVVRLPSVVADTFQNINKERLDNNSVLPKKYIGKVKYTRDKMRVDPSVVKGFFEETCNQICAIAGEHLGNIESAHDCDINNIIMVGGFSESKVLQDKVRKKFPGKRLIIPEEAGLAVLKGAVLYGHDPSMIVARVCKKTYGICAFRNFEPALDKAEKRFVHEANVLCKDRFSIHARKGQKFETGTVVGTNKYVPSDPGATEMQIDVYVSDRDEPRYVDEGDSRRVGQMRVPLGNRNGQKEVLIQFVFGDTELGVVAEVNGKKTRGKFDFL